MGLLRRSWIGGATGTLLVQVPELAIEQVYTDGGAPGPAAAARGVFTKK